MKENAPYEVIGELEVPQNEIFSKDQLIQFTDPALSEKGALPLRLIKSMTRTRTKSIFPNPTSEWMGEQQPSAAILITDRRADSRLFFKYLTTVT